MSNNIDKETSSDDFKCIIEDLRQDQASLLDALKGMFVLADPKKIGEPFQDRAIQKAGALIDDIESKNND